MLPPQPSPEIFSEEATEASEAAEEDDLGGGKEVSYTSSLRPHTLVAADKSFGSSRGRCPGGREEVYFEYNVYVYIYIYICTTGGARRSTSAVA